MPKQIEINPKKLAAIGRKSFWFFCRVIMKNDWLTKEVHLDLCNFLQQDYPNKKLVELPRGFLKTTVASVYYPIWLAINNPSIRILLVQNTFENAAKRVHEIRSIFERNDLFKALYNEIVPNFNSKNIRWSNECAEVNRPTTFPEGTFESAGVGTKLTSRHYDVIIEDDLVTADTHDLSGEEIAPNMEDVDKAIGWHKMATNLLIDYKTSKRIHIGTRWFQEDMINHIKTHEPGYARFLKTVYDEDGNAIYPKRFDDEVLDAKKEEMGTYMFATQMLLDPMPLEKMIFKPNWNRYFNTAPETKNVLAIDPAIGESKQNCDSGFAVVGGAPNGLIYIHEAFGKQMNLTEQVRITFKLVRDYNIHKVVVETIAYQEALAQAIALERDRVDEKGVKVNEDVHFSIVKEVPGGKDKKDARIKSMIPYFENGKVLMKKNMSKLQKQLREYPFGKKRDVIDVLAYAIRNAVHTKKFVKQKEVDPLSFEAIMKELEDKSKQNSLFPKAKGFVASGMSRYY